MSPAIGNKPHLTTDRFSNARVFAAADAEAAASQAAGFILEKLGEAVGARGRATLAISGGSSPKPLFRRLASAASDWNGIHIFWVDERAVPPDHADSNFRLARELLLDPARIPERQIHRVEAELEPELAARRYSDEMERFFGLRSGQIPSFDVLHLGLGPDGHTASLFPGGPLIADRAGIASAVYVDKMKTWRITLLPGVLLAANHTLIFAPGQEKVAALRGIWGQEYDPQKWPAQLIARYGREVNWFLDHAAAQGLDVDTQPPPSAH